IAGRMLWFYVGKLAWPHPLIFIYPRWTIDPRQPIEYLPALAAAIGLLLLWRGRNGRRRSLFFAAAYFAVSLFPVSGAFNIYFFRYSFVADHFQYLAAIGPLALAGAGIAAAFRSIKEKNRFMIPATKGVLLGLCGLLTWQQSGVYANPISLWSDTLAENPNAWMAHTNLGAELDDQGRFLDAIDEYRAALRINSNDAGAHNNLAAHLAKLGRQHEAISEWEQAVQIQPGIAEVHTNLAYALAQVGRTPEAFQHSETAL